MADPYAAYGGQSQSSADPYAAYGGKSTPPPPPQDADERFARSFNKGITGAEDPGQLWQNLKGEASQIAANPSGEADPTKILQGIHQGMTALWNRATEEAKQGNLTTAKGLLNYLNAGVHFVESGVPVVGPMMGQADQQMSQGNVAGGAGTATAAIAPMVMGGVGTNAALNTGEVTNAAATPARIGGAVKHVANVVREQAPGVVGGGVGAALGHATGIPGMGEVGGIAGYAMGKKLFPVADEVAAQDIPKAEPIPANPEPVPAAQYLSARKAGATDAEARAQSGAIYKDAQEARHAVSSAIDEVIPPEGASKTANLKAKAEAQFYVDRGNTDAAIAAVEKNAPDFKPWRAPKSPSEPAGQSERLADVRDDAAVRQSMQADLDKQYATGRLVEGREQAARNSADLTKVAGTEGTQGQNISDRYSNLPLPEASMEANKMVGYDPRGIGKPVKLTKTPPVKSPIQAAQDFTAILEESLKQVKARKSNAP